ncbi:MAG: cob(I)yrinic acid a,c-diamide adenosyltransferase [Bacteroidales bacterium]|jgi:cob(I)alamin adenosyltransferase|nr:cob(I)yrinic acid a,c-diamide adenosyltransferase [Bacteroidales bacterium]MDD2323599.1 cob(I)yrinic acid a,c-diamide adenosyltransferase [Bacteroidales bacterium]MDD3010612.1 cob(I)yrinic acid a,c-diamide adenosyltransferase [Bacteroidales bacterium]MDD3961428.1 cob(I)yrinic acid a,c-diamide adenosyltransferase [Bacteroidales bacterium]MDY0286067.1 cob(I)yrinic acid a,c-diamide adenosyltransferase [Bacteroidales bacterium]
MQGMVHVYTGNGKGKTTAAFGLSLRAAGAGKNVFFAQFVKGRSYAEIRAVEKYLPMITVKQYGLDCFIYNDPTEKDIQAAQKGLEEVTGILSSGQYDVVVLDEAAIALYYRLFSLDSLWNAINGRAEKTEVIVTGRYAPQELIDNADLVTEMKEIKHYYSKGIEAREGIEY